MSDGRAVLWDRESGRKLLTTGKEKDERRRPHAVASLAFSPDGSRFLVGQDGSRRDTIDAWNSRCIEVFNTNTGKRQLIMRGADKRGGFSNDGSKIVTETAIRDAQTGKRSLVLATRFYVPDRDEPKRRLGVLLSRAHAFATRQHVGKMRPGYCLEYEKRRGECFLLKGVKNTDANGHGKSR